MKNEEELNRACTAKANELTGQFTAYCKEIENEYRIDYGYGYGWSHRNQFAIYDHFQSWTIQKLAGLEVNLLNIKNQELTINLLKELTNSIEKATLLLKGDL